ncbi:MAG: penicillin-binding protein [Clostridia bacterium]|nr:penicillin-binding protein [Clostridia bacterium]
MEKKSKNKQVRSVGSKVSRKKTPNPKAKNKKKHAKLKKVLIIFLLLIILLVLVGIGIFCGIFFSDKFALSKEDLLLANANTVVYDKDGNVIAELSGSENREIISIGDMSEYLPKAFVAIEDERFYNHSGVDLKRTLAATTTYLIKGDSSFGGSTITQQLIKNITNERDNTGKAGVERKIKEMSRAYQVEKMISKDQILELYLNIIPLGADGGDICGVEIASTYYFNKSASELSIEECAFLAGINNAPNTYNPFKNADNAEKQAQVMAKIKTRTQTVLKKMKELGYITDEQYKTAYDKVEAGLTFTKGTLPTSTIKSYFIQAAIEQVIDDLVEQKGFSEEYAKSRVYGGGYKIYTTEVAAVQTNLEEVYKSDKYILTSSKSDTHSQSAMVVIDHTTGQVAGCMGGLGTDVDAIGINRATNMKRQSGSSIKPIVTYGCGVETGVINAGTVYYNSPTTFGKDYSPSSTSMYSGPCTVRNAIEVSSNVVACKIMSEIGPDNAIDFARKCGLSSLVKASENSKANDSNLPSMALGGLTIGVSPLEMAGAYSMIANNGVYISPTFYTKVEDSSGAIVIECNQTTERVMTEQNAYIMKTLLKQPVEGAHGTATNCKIEGMDVGAKTGTTNDNYDRWLCGITPYYTAATWYGYDNNNGKKAEVNGSGNYAAKIWIDIMKRVHQDLPKATFTVPSGIVEIKICKKSGCKATGSCSETYTEYYAEDSVPKDCEGHSLKICSDSKKLATENCPNTYYFSFVPEKERKPSWKTSSGISSSAPSDQCDIHKTPQNPNTDNNNNNDVDVIISSDIIIPNVVGKTETAARNELKDLVVDVRTKSDKSKNNGEVISQSLPPKTIVAKGTKITIIVNKIEDKQLEQNKIPDNVIENNVNEINIINNNNTLINNTVNPGQ